MHRTFLSLGAAVVLLAMAAPVPAQGQGFFVTFNFDTLEFTFFPEGLGAAPHAGTGSGIQANALNVRIEGFDAIDLRHCIDGHEEPDCSYGTLLAQLEIGDRDGNVTATEVDAFEDAVEIGFALNSIERVARLNDLLENNITVDGKIGKTPRVVDFQVYDAEGSVNSSATVRADVTIEVGYDNRKDVDHHEIHVTNLNLTAEGFEYATVLWKAESSRPWRYDASATLPVSMQDRVSAQGWESDQATFESASTDTVRLAVDKEGAGGVGGANALWWVLGIVAVAGVAAAVYFAMRRRRA